ncbi:MAG TPA: divalent-cation tolerance protein CutA [Stellaceae bacterium]|nr:divalent-cation tolerance protein CutA [Stellaceae bacterium]
MPVMFVYATAGDAAEALRIGRAVVEERLAACANVLGGMRSVYWWQGAVQEGVEAVLVLKTTDDRLGALIARVRELHSYDCPCIEALPVTGGYQGFLDWVAGQTHDSHAPGAAPLSGGG